MRILHTADLHNGDSRNIPGYFERQDKMLAELLRIAVEKNVDLFLIAGDLNDSEYMLEREKNRLLQWFIDLDNAAEKHGFDVLIINGNHDIIEAAYTHVHQHFILSKAGLYQHIQIVEHEPKLLGPFKDHTYVLCIPPRMKAYAGDEINFIVDSFRKQLDDRLEDKYVSWKARRCSDKSRPVKPEEINFIVMLHEAIVGSKNETGTYTVKRGPHLDPRLNVTYWALGDIHKPFQKVLPNAWYPGSPIQHDWGETEVERGVLIVDTDKPEKPQPILLKGITPLITVSTPPEEWPEDSLIRFEGTPSEISKTKFPENVIGFKPVIDVEKLRKSVNAKFSDSLLDGIDKVLCEFPEEYRKDILDEIKEAIKTL